MTGYFTAGFGGLVSGMTSSLTIICQSSTETRFTPPTPTPTLMKCGFLFWRKLLQGIFNEEFNPYLLTCAGIRDNLNTSPCKLLNMRLQQIVTRLIYHFKFIRFVSYICITLVLIDKNSKLVLHQSKNLILTSYSVSYTHLTLPTICSV